MGIYSWIAEETLTFLGRRFGLSDVPGTGITCGENGLFVGPVPLLKRLDGAGSGGRDQWQPRPVSDLNRELSKCYDLPVEFDRKIDAIRAVAQALDRG